jgi:ParB family chromosome partitioning protein
MKKMTGLGRGLDALIDTSHVDTNGGSSISEIEINAIVANPDQPRRTFDEEALQELADSIREHGVISPITLRDNGDGTYMIIAGERRWRASKIAGLDKIPAIIRTLDAQKRLELSLIENVQREDLNPIEVATVYAKFRSQFNLTNAEISKRVGKSESAIVNTTRLLNLPEEAKRAMVDHQLSEGQMRPLVTLTPEQINEVLPKIIEEGWSARKVEQYKVDLTNRNKAKKAPQGQAQHTENTAIAESIHKKIGSKVKITTSARGSGEIVLKFKDKQEFEKLCTILTA